MGPGGARCGGHWNLGEAVYWKPQTVNHETYNEDNRKIAGRGDSPHQGMMECKNVPNRFQKLSTLVPAL